MKTIYTITFSFVFSLSLQAQCDPPETIRFLHGNAIRAAVTTGGDMFWDGQDAQFRITAAAGQPATIFAQALWLGGIDPIGQLKMASQTDERGRGAAVFYPGPLAGNGLLPNAETCRQWDRVWSVSRHEIEAHIRDFEDNQAIDGPLPAIMQWPGRGNPYFEGIFGFALPDDEQGLAPFADIDGDGVYDPLAGDYPAVEGLAVLPEQLMWSVFNDLGGPWADPTQLLNLEIQRTSWALRCLGDSPLNNTVFVSYKLINRSAEPIDSLVLGLWTDFDLGCYLDDYVGAAPEQDAFFVYNATPVDLTPCVVGTASFGENPPAQAVALLNRPLTAFYYFGGEAGGPPPVSNLGRFRIMNGLFADGTPITEGGNGYETGGPPTPFAFHGDPNDPAQWSMLHENMPPRDYRGIGSTALGRLAPGEATVVETAQLYVREPGGNHLENVAAMYLQLEALREGYEEGFAAACQLPALCQADCVWPGDANADGIADHEDLLAIGQNLGATGPARGGFYNWAPYEADAWSALGLKHADADGDGIIQASDLLVLELNYGQTRPGYVEQAEYPVGPELRAFAALPGGYSGVTAGAAVLTRISLADVPGLKGLAFSLEYDPRFFEGTSSPLFSQGEFRIRQTDPVRHQVDFARYAAGASDFIGPADHYELFVIQAKAVFDEPVPSNTTYLRFKNIVAIRADGTRIPIGGMDLMATFEGVALHDAEEEAAAPLRLFPNPTDGILQIEFPGQQPGHIALYNAAGQQLQLAQGPFLDRHQLNLRGLPAGLYFVRIEIAGAAIVRKLVLR